MCVGATAPENSQSKVERLAGHHETGSECHCCRGNEGLGEEAALVSRACPIGPYVGQGLVERIPEYH